jgi:2-hydroxychromene-2-carboxylate isomerase
MHSSPTLRWLSLRKQQPSRSSGCPTLRIAEFMGTVEERTPHFWRKVHYMYMDARRFANAQGLELKGPKRIYDAFYSSAGMLYAQRQGFFRPYHETVFTRFWNHELELDHLSEISGIITGLGGSAADFEAYAEGPARGEHDRIIAEAELQGVFGVPTMVFNGELFWGSDRIPLLIERIRTPELADIALGRKRAVGQAAERPSQAQSRPSIS